jgi:hypothetical protein
MDVARPENPTGSSTGFSKLTTIFVSALLVTICMRLTMLRFMKRRTEVLEISHYAKEKYPSSFPELCQTYPKYARSNRHQRSTFRPVYPWIDSPGALPIPSVDSYDLNTLPTIRRHSSVDPRQANPLETRTVSYTRRVSTNSIPARESPVIHGTITTSRGGWRRHQWVVSGV